MRANTARCVVSTTAAADGALDHQSEVVLLPRGATATGHGIAGHPPGGVLSSANADNNDAAAASSEQNLRGASWPVSVEAARRAAGR